MVDCDTLALGAAGDGTPWLGSVGCGSIWLVWSPVVVGVTTFSGGLACIAMSSAVKQPGALGIELSGASTCTWSEDCFLTWST